VRVPGSLSMRSPGGWEAASATTVSSLGLRRWPARLAAAREAADPIEAEGRTIDRALLRADALTLGLRRERPEASDAVLPDPPPARLRGRHAGGPRREDLWAGKSAGLATLRRDRFPKSHRLTEHRVVWMREEVAGFAARRQSRAGLNQNHPASRPTGDAR